jgi:hypothetical protein
MTNQTQEPDSLWNRDDIWNSRADARMLTNAISQCSDSTRSEIAINMLAQMHDTLEVSTIRELESEEEIQEAIQKAEEQER